MPGIIVGVDGSDHSHHALCWAMREAVLRHAPLTVMTVVPSAARPATMSFWGLHTLPEGGFNAEHARRAVQEAADKAASEISETPPEITVSVATGRRRKNSWQLPVTLTCSSWGPAAPARSPGSCSAR